MAWWLEDAKAHGIVVDWQYEPKAWELCEQHDLLYYKERVTKTKTPKTIREMNSKTMIEKQTYTCDFKIVWNIKYEGILFKRYDRILKGALTPYFWAREEESQLEVYDVTYVDVKPGFAQQGQQSFVRFPVKQAWVYDKYGVYVQKLIITQSLKHKLGRRYSGLFVSTFVPERYLLTDSGGQRRKINFEFKTIQEYVKSATTEKTF